MFSNNRNGGVLQVDSVCFVSPRFPPYIGGVETHVSELAERAAAHFRKVSVITTDPRGGLPELQENENSLRIYRVKSFAPRENYHFPSPIGMLRCVKACRPDVLHLHSIHDIPGPFAGLINGNLSLLTPHFVGMVNSRLGRILFSAYRPILREVVRKVSYVICMSRYEAHLMRKDFPASKEKIRIIPNGVDADLLASYSWKEPNRPRIIYAGRLERYKNVDKLVQAFASLYNSNLQLRLAVVGTGPAKEELIDLTRQLAIGGAVEWYERIGKSQLYELFSESSAVVVPSQFENYGIVAAEAISLGVPTVVANSSALSEFVETGLALGVDSPLTSEGLRLALAKVLEDPKAFSFRREAAKFIRSWNEVAGETFALYESLN